MSQFNIAVIPGDGIGTEVIPEGLKVLEAAASQHQVKLNFTHFDWSCETYHRTGRMMPEDGLEQLKKFDAIFLGAVGFPGVPDHISLWGCCYPSAVLSTNMLICVRYAYLKDQIPFSR